MASPLDHLNAKVFSEQLHTTFHIHADTGEPLPVELIEVEEKEATPTLELFFLRFRGPQSPRLPQSIYRLRHDKLGSFEIFLTVIGADQQGTLYESVFNRFRKNPADARPGQSKDRA